MVERGWQNSEREREGEGKWWREVKTREEKKRGQKRGEEKRTGEKTREEKKRGQKRGEEKRTGERTREEKKRREELREAVEIYFLCLYRMIK